MNFIPPKGLLIDFDGTLVDAFMPIVLAWNETLTFFGKATYSSEKIRRITGQSGYSFEIIFGKAHANQAREKFSTVHDAIHLQHIHPLPGAVLLLDELLLLQIPVILLTNKAEERAQLQVQHLGWQGYFQHIIGAVQGRAAKPDPCGVHLGCQYMQQQEQDCIVIGDGLNDMQAAVRAGCRGIGLCADFHESELRQAGATQCFNDLYEVKAWLKQTN